MIRFYVFHFYYLYDVLVIAFCFHRMLRVLIIIEIFGILRVKKSHGLVSKMSGATIVYNRSCRVDHIRNVQTGFCYELEMNIQLLEPLHKKTLIG